MSAWGVGVGVRARGAMHILALGVLKNGVQLLEAMGILMCEMYSV